MRHALGWGAALAVTVTAWCGLPWAMGTALVLVAVTAPTRPSGNEPDTDDDTGA